MDSARDRYRQALAVIIEDAVHHNEACADAINGYGEEQVLANQINTAALNLGNLLGALIEQHTSIGPAIVSASTSADQVSSRLRTNFASDTDTRGPEGPLAGLVPIASTEAEVRAHDRDTGGLLGEVYSRMHTSVLGIIRVLNGEVPDGFNIQLEIARQAASYEEGLDVGVRIEQAIEEQQGHV